MTAHAGRSWSTSLGYSIVGALLGLGAPLGFLGLRTLLKHKPARFRFRDELRVERPAYSYMALTTPIVFGAFGHLLGRRHDALRRAQDQINRMHEEFCSVAAHDLRSPIAALALRLDMLRADAKDGSVTVDLEKLEKLGQQCRRLDQMVSQLLDATRIEAGKLRLDLAATAVPDLVTSLADRLRPTIANHELQVAVQGAPPSVMVDTLRLEEIVTNLIENAAKYSPAGTPIRIEIGSERGGVTLRVSDRGSGIGPDELPHIFERYYQTERARAKKSGLGLGLYIVKGLVEAHGGRISVESEVNRGTTFSIWLPAMLAQSSTSSVAKQAQD